MSAGEDPTPDGERTADGSSTDSVLSCRRRRRHVLLTLELRVRLRVRVRTRLVVLLTET